MKIEDIFEAPQNTFPTEFGLDNYARNTEFTRLLMKQHKKSAVMKIDDRHTLWEFDREYAVINDGDMRVEYYMRFRFDMVKMLQRQCVRQIAVWRSNYPVTRGLAKKIFSEVLVPRYQTVITDAEQTPDGRRFWADRIADALTDSALFVYYINIMHPREIVRVHSAKEYRDVVEQKPAYGDSNVFQNRRFIITSKPFDK